MARHYYLTRSGRLRRKDNTLFFELSADAEIEKAEGVTVEEEAGDVDEINPVDLMGLEPSAFDLSVTADGMGELALEPEVIAAEEMIAAEDQAEPVRVGERRTIPVEDVDALWAFGELELNARVLVFLSQHKIPIHFFNYYGFYAGTYYPREYLQAGYLVVRQVRHYSNRRLRLVIAREFVHSAMHNILRNLRYYGTRGVDLQTETESVQSEMLRLAAVKTVDELMGCEGRARAAYYTGFSKILRTDVEFTKRVRRPPDNIVNALISFTNGLVYSATLTQIYRTQLDPTISFLHEPGARRFSLALDLAEVFKPILADRLLFKLLNNRQLSDRDFAQDLNCCYLKESGRKKVLKEWDARLQTTIEHRRLRRKVSYERLIRLECYKLVKHLTNVEPYTGFRAWW
ncbi:MAG: type I-B CRISPR-associated endonuclease Cas1 [Pyrinomonadaceae bacterium]|nr:type I-B CRISPR-associated endonuclease Cas1 [Pyrinomonadaceae bacterium]